MFSFGLDNNSPEGGLHERVRYVLRTLHVIIISEFHSMTCRKDYLDQMVILNYLQLKFYQRCAKLVGELKGLYIQMDEDCGMLISFVERGLFYILVSGFESLNWNLSVERKEIMMVYLKELCKG